VFRWREAEIYEYQGDKRNVHRIVEDKPNGVRKLPRYFRRREDYIEVALKETQKKVVEQWHRQGDHKPWPQGTRRPGGLESTKY
jgi:hypothetical protein